MRTFEGRISGDGLKVAIICSRFNDLVTRSLLEGALGGLRRHGVNDNAIDVLWVPGALEIPLAAQAVAVSKTHDAIITLGAVIRGATGHYDVVVSGCAAGVQQVQLELGIPVVFGVLTTDTVEQALERSGIKSGNKGYDAAATAIEMVNVLAAFAAKDDSR